MGKVFENVFSPGFMRDGRLSRAREIAQSPPTTTIGPLKGSQYNKGLIDAAKLSLANKLFDEDGRLVLLFAGKEAAKYFQGKSWKAEFIDKSGVEIQIVELPSELKQRVRDAQDNQYR